MTVNITMAELLARAGRPIIGFSTGQRVKGKVIAKGKNFLNLDIGGKSEGQVVEKAFIEAREFIKTLDIGDEVEATVLVPETKEGMTILSLRQVAAEASWKKLTAAKNQSLPVVVLGKGVNPAGITVEVEGLSGFIPTSHLGKEVSKNPQALVGQHFKAVPLEIDKPADKIILSEKEVSDAADIKLVREALKKVKEGEIYEGVVTTVTPFGCFVRIEVGKVSLEGLVHISEISWSKVGQMSDAAKEGERVKVRVIGLRDGKLAFSIKRAGEDPWKDAEKKYQIESKVKGRVVKSSDFGVFVELEPGVEGLIHLTSIPPGKKLGIGEEVGCFVQEINSKTKKLSLGLVLTEKPVGYK